MFRSDSIRRYVRQGIGAAACAAALLAAPVTAFELKVEHQDARQCDPLRVPRIVDELGLGPPGAPPQSFPEDEIIAADAEQTQRTSCPATDDPDLPNVLMTMTNRTQYDFSQVWYVADTPDTKISNFDGDVSNAVPLEGQAFLIDAFGSNRPLLDETMAFDGIFESGETWFFVIQDYQNRHQGAPFQFTSVGRVGSGSPGNDPDDSTGSIIAVRAPFCDVEMTQPRYVRGDIVTMSTLRYANPAATPLFTRLRLQIEVTPIPLTINVLDLPLTVPAGLDNDLAPVTMFPVGNQPPGLYRVRCAFEDPITGAVQAEDIAEFEILQGP